MIGRIVFGVGVLAPCVLGAAMAHAQDVPGIEICTVEKTMERRTSCLQSNIEFLQKTIVKLDAIHQQRLDAANRQVEALKANVIALQKVIEELKAAQSKPPDDKTKPEASPAKDTAVKDGAAKDAAKDGAKQGAK
jgi:TolA-binding protein